MFIEAEAHEFLELQRSETLRFVESTLRSSKAK
jgi:hypothetical protein